jgi:hypothetical protein
MGFGLTTGRDEVCTKQYKAELALAGSIWKADCLRFEAIFS